MKYIYYKQKLNQDSNTPTGQGVGGSSKSKCITKKHELVESALPKAFLAFLADVGPFLSVCDFFRIFPRMDNATVAAARKQTEHENVSDPFKSFPI